ncbi:MAG: glycoside hydrolase [Bacteroidetes bacterium]|nr:glycoside hydrolase [Rhodothermaceae bacterium RA]RMH62264.1 MAG: glycoside hydrolase [Bacteroidota bacterium]
MVEKKLSPKGKSVRVTFELPADVAEKSVAIVGDFNDWDASRHPMELKKKKGVWTKTISLPPGEKYEFRYLVDNAQWRNDEAADGYVPNPYFEENSVLEL